MISGHFTLFFDKFYMYAPSLHVLLAEFNSPKIFKCKNDNKGKHIGFVSCGIRHSQLKIHSLLSTLDLCAWKMIILL